jgi:hypothetical protein
MHHQTLKSAVKQYSTLHIEGQSEEDVKKAIAADEKGFDEVDVDEIYAAILKADAADAADAAGDNGDAGDKGDAGDNAPVVNKSTKGKSHIVKQPFRDIKNFDKIHSVGSNVSHFDAKRLEGLVKNGLVEIK